MLEKTVEACLFLSSLLCIVTAASAQTTTNCTARPDGYGGSRMDCTSTSNTITPTPPPPAESPAEEAKRMNSVFDRARSVSDASARYKAEQAAKQQAVVKTDLPLSAGETMWTSIKTGNDFKIRVTEDYIYTQRADLPSNLQGSAFIRSEFKKVDGKWVGKAYSHLPYQDKKSTKWCDTELDIEIDKLSDSRIEGMAPHPSSFNVKTCQPENVEMQAFTWIPK
jgi:hypothetical protein